MQFGAVDNPKQECHSELEKQPATITCLESALTQSPRQKVSHLTDTPLALSHDHSVGRPSGSDLTLCCRLTFDFGTTASHFTWPSASLSHFF